MNEQWLRAWLLVGDEVCVRCREGRKEYGDYCGTCAQDLADQQEPDDDERNTFVWEGTTDAF